MQSFQVFFKAISVISKQEITVQAKPQLRGSKDFSIVAMTTAHAHIYRTRFEKQKKMWLYGPKQYSQLHAGLLPVGYALSRTPIVWILFIRQVVA